MKEVISTPKAPQAIGPYSQAIRSGNFIFCSGQIPLDPISMQVVGSTAAEQTQQILSNLTALLTSAGSDLNRVIKTTIFLKNMSDFETVNQVYGRYFKVDPPARSTIEVARLPKDVLVEIECIAAG